VTSQLIYLNIDSFSWFLFGVLAGLQVAWASLQLGAWDGGAIDVREWLAFSPLRMAGMAIVIFFEGLIPLAVGLVIIWLFVSRKLRWSRAPREAM